MHYISLIYKLLTYTKGVYDLYYWISKKEIDDKYKDWILIDDK